MAILTTKFLDIWPFHKALGRKNLVWQISKKLAELGRAWKSHKNRETVNSMNSIKSVLVNFLLEFPIKMFRFSLRQQNTSSLDFS